MKRLQQARGRAIAALIGTAAALSGCGSDGGEPTASGPIQVPDIPAGINGVAATGAALTGATVTVIDRTGASVCTEAEIVTRGNGSYHCTLASGKSAPFLVIVTDPTGAHAPLVGIATTTPKTNAPVVANATPLTTAIISQLAPDKSALSVAANPALIDVAALTNVKNNVLAQIADVLAAIGAPAGFDPFTTGIVASTASVSGNTADQIIELLRFSAPNGVPTVGTVDRPDAAVALADASATAPAKLAAPSESAIGLADALKSTSASLEACFAVEKKERVTSTDNTIPLSAGGPEVTGTAKDCDGIFDDAYLHNGYRAGQALYGLLTDDAMTGASFSLPEVVQFFDDTSTADEDRAIVNIRYVDANGIAGNLITVARKTTDKTTTPATAQWTLYGNQQPVDTSIAAFVRRNEQRNPTPPASASISRYETGLDIFINKDGPGSQGIRAARVKGPGLPPAGIVLTPASASLCSAQNWMNILRKDGATEPASTPPSGGTTNLFRLQRTAGLTGADATTVRPNPNATNSNRAQYPYWAHPLDYGAPLGSTGYIDFAALKPLSTYSFELYYGQDTAPKYTLTKTLLTAVLPSTTAGSVQWVSLTSATLGYLDATNALAVAASSFNLAWNANPYAETIRSAGVYTFDATGQVNQGQVAVAKGALMATANAPTGSGCDAGTQFKALTADGTSGRTIQLRYRMLDGSYKDSTSSYD